MLNTTIDLYGGCGNSATSCKSSSRARPGSRKVTSHTSRLGDVNPGAATLKRLARALDVSVAELLE